MRPATRSAAVLLLCAAALLYAVHVPSVVPATAPASEFSAERAMQHVRVIAERPHPIGSEDHARVRQYLVDAIAALGLEPQVQEATAIGTRYPEAGHVKNVLVRVAGSQLGGPAVLLMAHYDAVPAAPGAGDNASGTAVLLETLRALKASPPLRHDVIALIADGEEAGLLGAAAFVREHPWARDVEVTLNFEARGMSGPSLMFETGAGNLDVVRALRRAGGGRATSLSTAVYRRLPNDTDLSETARLGKPALNFAFIGDVRRYHTAQDAVEHLDARSVQDHGESALELAREFAGNPLPRPASPDAVFFDFPMLGVVVYPVALAPVFALLGLLAVGYLLFTVRRAEPLWLRGTALGATGAAAAAVTAAIAGAALGSAYQTMHAAMGSGSPAQSGMYVAATALAALAIAAASYNLLRRWVPGVALQAGAVLLMATLSLLTAVAVPEVSFLFTWPALVMAAALAGWGTNRVLRESMLWVATAVTLFMLVPITYLMGAVALGLDATGGAVVALFTAMTAWLLAHVMEPGKGRGWWPAGGAAAAAIALIAAGALTVRTSERHPAGSSIGYGVDNAANQAFVGVTASRSALQPLRSQLGDAAVRPPDWFARYFRSVRPAPIAAGLPRAVVQELGDSVADGERHLTLRVRPEGEIRVVGLSADSGAVLAAWFDGRAVDTSGFRNPMRGRWHMEFHAPPDSGFTLALRLGTSDALALSVVSQLPGIPQVQGLEVPDRPPGVIPIQRGDFTVVHERVTIPAVRPPD